MPALDRGQVGLGDLGVQLQAAVADDAEELRTGGDDLALGHGATADQPADGRADRGLGHARGGLASGGLGGGQVGGARTLARGGGVEAGLAEIALGLQLAGPVQGGVGLGQGGLGAGDGGVLLAQLGRDERAVELDQDLAGLDGLAFLGIDGDGGQAARLGADRHFFPRRDGAGGVDLAGDRLAGDRDDADGGRGAGRGLGLLRLLVAAPGQSDRAHAQDQNQRAQCRAAPIDPVKHDFPQGQLQPTAF
jgi:hypothetical protein